MAIQLGPAGSTSSNLNSAMNVGKPNPTQQGTVTNTTPPGKVAVNPKGGAVGFPIKKGRFVSTRSGSPVSFLQGVMLEVKDEQVALGATHKKWETARSWIGTKGALATALTAGVLGVNMPADGFAEVMYGASAALVMLAGSSKLNTWWQNLKAKDNYKNTTKLVNYANGDFVGRQKYAENNPDKPDKIGEVNQLEDNRRLGKWQIGKTNALGLLDKLDKQTQKFRKTNKNNNAWENIAHGTLLSAGLAGATAALITGGGMIAAGAVATIALASLISWNKSHKDNQVRKHRLDTLQENINQQRQDITVNVNAPNKTVDPGYQRNPTAGDIFNENYFEMAMPAVKPLNPFVEKITAPFNKMLKI